MATIPKWPPLQNGCQAYAIQSNKVKVSVACHINKKKLLPDIFIFETVNYKWLPIQNGFQI